MMLAAISFPPIAEVLNWRPIAFSGTAFMFNKIAVLTLASAAITLVLFGLAGRRAQLVPRGVQNVVEAGVDFVRSTIVLDVMGPEGLSWLPWLVGMFFFILFNNLFEVVPFIQMPATARTSVTIPLAVISYVTFLAVGIKRQGFAGYFRSALVPRGVPGVLLILLVPIEFLSTFLVRPFALAVRLFGNMLAGHLLLITFAVISEALFVKSIALVALPLPAAMLVVVTGYEIFVGFLQAFIFTILTAVYIGEAMGVAGH
ncbi:ATP synthase F0, A subunit [Acidimicrobium ferrooxidans DSM 10331]|uniref:ATP synthase subunit a n=1 Tax=Acidimicrobium ferrooxidans (strain DSM 10331 / JCM 15462 / NBRC 103882 / ICP) TaxID=525909 RepID=C7M167_ACIFD|nr:ATP synthase F0, A subunit [Acidimicrobium ferrooxidans DSM 10331]